MKWRLHICSLEVTAWRQETQQIAKAILKREKSGKGAVFNLSAVLVTQHKENQEGWRAQGSNSIFSIPSNLSKQWSHVA